MTAPPPPACDDRATLLVIAILAACTSAIAHEALGHGTACLLAGGHITLLNNAFFTCTGGGRYTALAGPLGNLAAGLIAFAAPAFMAPKRSALRLYALLVMAFSLYWEAGYLIQAMIKDQGDSVFAYRDLVGPENLAVRIAAVALGVLAYGLMTRMVRLRAAPFADAPGRLQGLLRPAWVGGVVAMVLAGSLYSPDRLGAAKDAGLSLVASFPLLFARAPVRPAPGAAALARNPRLILVGLAAFVAFALSMGRGMTF